jgi:hypothetical protein
MICVGFVTLNSQFHVMRAYVTYYFHANCAMIYYILHLHKTYVIWKNISRGDILYYAMLHYIQMKLKGLLLVLANEVSGYKIY